MHYNVETDLIDPSALNLVESIEVDIPGIFCQFDCSWFLSIADIGYDTFPHGLTTGHAANWAFFPLFPLLGHWLGALLGIGTLKAFYLIRITSYNVCYTKLLRSQAHETQGITAHDGAVGGAAEQV